jgi:type VI secretion system protein ImpL
MNARILTVILLVVWLIIAWFTGSLLKLDGANLWLLRGLLALIGVIAAALVWWYLLRSAQSAGPVDITARTDDLALLLRVAEQKLRTSKLGRAARISSLPVVVFIGDRDAAKTSVIAQSGAEPELLAGQVYGDSVIVPTEAANCWFARGHVFIEVGGRLLGGATAFSQLIRSLKPQRLAFLKGAKNAARAAVICVPADVFLQPNASELTRGWAFVCRFTCCSRRPTRFHSLPITCRTSVTRKLPK